MEREIYLKRKEVVRKRMYRKILKYINESIERGDKPPSKKEIDEFIRQHREKGRKSPSRKEIAKIAGVSRPTVNNIITAMREEGLLDAHPTKLRGLSLTNLGFALMVSKQ